MKKQRGFFGWLTGGLAIAGVAAAATSAPVAPSPSPLAIASAPTAQPVASAPAAAPVQAPKPATEKGAQIWECTTKGVKTFSNNPCGRKSSLVTLRPLNTMESATVVRSARANEPVPPYTKEYTDQNLFPDQNAFATAFDDHPYPADQGYQGYGYAPAYAYAPLARGNHPHRREHHRDSLPEAHETGPKPHHSIPAPQRPMPGPR